MIPGKGAVFSASATVHQTLVADQTFEVTKRSIKLSAATFSPA
jgi:hypothetical protein